MRRFIRGERDWHDWRSGIMKNSTNWNHAQSVKEVVRHVAFNLGASSFLDK